MAARWRESRCAQNHTGFDALLLPMGTFIILATIVLVLALRLVSGAAPVLDALTTVLSLEAQYLLNRKVFENRLL